MLERLKVRRQSFRSTRASPREDEAKPLLKVKACQFGPSRSRAGNASKAPMVSTGIGGAGNMSKGSIDVLEMSC